MQQTLDRSWWQSARFSGVLRYHWKALGKTVSIVLLVLFAAQMATLIFPMISDNPYPYSGVYADLSITMIFALVCSCIAAGKGTRFLLRFGTSRVSVWLGNLVGLFAGMVAFLLGTLVLSILLGGAVLGLANALPDTFKVKTLFGDTQVTALFKNSLSESLHNLPAYILYTLEWTCLFYLLGTCLRRNRAITLTVILGVPMLLMMLTLIPAVRQAADVVQNANNSQMMLLGVQWMKYLVDFANFVEHEWPTIQLLAALVSLPLSYLCMRDTAQP